MDLFSTQNEYNPNKTVQRRSRRKKIVALTSEWRRCHLWRAWERRFRLRPFCGSSEGSILSSPGPFRRPSWERRWTRTANLRGICGWGGKKWEVLIERFECCVSFWWGFGGGYGGKVLMFCVFHVEGSRHFLRLYRD